MCTIHFSTQFKLCSLRASFSRTDCSYSSSSWRATSSQSSCLPCSFLCAAFLHFHTCSCGGKLSSWLIFWQARLFNWLGSSIRMCQETIVHWVTTLHSSTNACIVLFWIWRCDFWVQRLHMLFMATFLRSFSRTWHFGKSFLNWNPGGILNSTDVVRRLVRIQQKVLIHKPCWNRNSFGTDIDFIFPLWLVGCLIQAMILRQKLD